MSGRVMTMANTLAYYDAAKITTVTSFTMKALVLA
jgi:hypothetical protein